MTQTFSQSRYQSISQLCQDMIRKHFRRFTVLCHCIELIYRGVVAISPPPPFFRKGRIFGNFNASSDNFRHFAASKDNSLEFYLKTLNLAPLLYRCHDAPVHITYLLYVSILYYVVCVCVYANVFVSLAEALIPFAFLELPNFLRKIFRLEIQSIRNCLRKWELLWFCPMTAKFNLFIKQER